MTEVTPHAINGIGWRTFIMFGVFCFAMGVFIFVFAKETKGRSLEEMDILFGAVDADQRMAHVEQTMYKSEVTHAERVDEEVAVEIGRAHV